MQSYILKNKIMISQVGVWGVMEQKAGLWTGFVVLPDFECHFSKWTSAEFSKTTSAINSLI
jgi:hypothetical protein